MNQIVYSQVSMHRVLDGSQSGKSLFRGNRARKRISQTLTRVEVEYQNICQELEDDEGYAWKYLKHMQIPKAVPLDVVDTGCDRDEDAYGAFVSHFKKDAQGIYIY